jgi:predicted AlkP superfamily pyrophosphatase or phosphodiesterase
LLSVNWEARRQRKIARAIHSCIRPLPGYHHHVKTLQFALAFVLALMARSMADPVPAKERIVILISVDGFPAWIWQDPNLVIPNLRKLAAEGAVAGRMTVSNPSITWINHTTLVTGVNPRKHGVLFNGLLMRGGPTEPLALEPWRDKAELVRVPTVYDAAFQAGLKTAQVDWVAILNSGTINHEFLEIPKPGGAIEQEMIAAGTVTADDIRNWTKGRTIVWRDAIWTKAAVHIIEQHRPNLLLYHLLTTDAVNHANGPGTIASYTAYAYADRLIGDLLEALTRAGLRERATIIVATDHGFKKVQKVIHTNVALRDAGLIRVKDSKVESCDAYVMPQGGLAFVYVTDPARRAELLPKLKTLCGGLEGVAKVIDGHDGPTLGMPTPAENQGMGDLVLYAKDGYAFFQGFEGAEVVRESKIYLGTHGYLNSDPELDGIFLASGYGIKPGTKLDRVTNLDVAPTIAELLGVLLPNVDGRALREILQP